MLRTIRMRTSFEFINRSERIVKFLCANSWELHKLNFSLRMLQPILSKGSLLLFAIHKWIKDVISIALQFHRLLSMLSGKCPKSTWIWRLLLATNILFDLSGCGRSCGCGGRCGIRIKLGHLSSSFWSNYTKWKRAAGGSVTPMWKNLCCNFTFILKPLLAIKKAPKMSKSHQTNIRVNKWTECFSTLSRLLIFMRDLFKTSPMETRPCNLLCNFCKARYLMFEALRGAFENPSKVAIQQAICCFKALWRSQWTEWKE